MNGIRISLDEVNEVSMQIASLNAAMNEHLGAMKRDMNSLDGNWISDAGMAIRSRFNGFSARFERQKEVIDSYVRFLHLTVASYESLESAIASNAQNMQQ